MDKLKLALIGCGKLNAIVAKALKDGYLPDFVAEAASVKSIQDYSEIVLNGSSNLVALSIGAFTDQEFYERVKNTAARNNRRVYIASGADCPSQCRSRKNNYDY